MKDLWYYLNLFDTMCAAHPGCCKRIIIVTFVQSETISRSTFGVACAQNHGTMYNSFARSFNQIHTNETLSWEQGSDTKDSSIQMADLDLCEDSEKGVLCDWIPSLSWKRRRSDHVAQSKSLRSPNTKHTGDAHIHIKHCGQRGIAASV